MPPALVKRQKAEGILAARWWTLDELRATTETVFPTDLETDWRRLLPPGHATG